MAILIPSLIHAACIVSVQTRASQPMLISALGVKSVARSAPDSLGAFDLKLEQPIDPKTALLYATVNWTMGPAAAIQAVTDATDATLVHVYTSQNVVAGGNFTASALSDSTSGIQGVGHSSTGVYKFTLAAPLPRKNDGYDGVSILVTPESSKTFVHWTVISDTDFEVDTTDETGSSVDAGFSLALLPIGQGSYTVDCDFSLLVADLGAAGAIPNSE